MKTITSSCTNAFVDRHGDRGFKDLSVSRLELCFLPPKTAANFQFLQLVSVPHKALRPARPYASLVPESEVSFEEEIAEPQPEQDCSNKVHVIIQLQKECSFGDNFLIVGDDPMFGLWDPENALPMNWSEGHVWKAEMDIPVGLSVNFKFIMKSSTGEITWQPSPDRNLTTWQSENTIVVCEDWENSQYQTIMEEKPLAYQDEDPALHSSMSENLMEPAHGVTSQDFMEPAHFSSSNVIVAEEVITDKGLAVTFRSPTAADMEESLNIREGDPILVPGLMSSSTSSAEVETQNEDEKKTEDASVKGEAKVHSSPEVEEKLGPNGAHRVEIMVMSIDDEEELNHKPTIIQSKEEQPDSQPMRILENDFHWGRKTLEKLLNSLRFLLQVKTW